MTDESKEKTGAYLERKDYEYPRYFARKDYEL